MIPGDKRSPFVTSGVRLGTPAITTRGLVDEHMVMLADWIHLALTNSTNEETLKKIKMQVIELCKTLTRYTKYKICIVRVVMPKTRELLIQECFLKKTPYADVANAMPVKCVLRLTKIFISKCH